jgi:apoptosis-inducing factor 2
MKKIVIVGGGIAGKTVAEGLLKHNSAEITLIEPKEYMEVPFAQLRALVEPKDFSASIRKPYSLLLPGVNHIRQKASGLKDRQLILEDGEALEYDFLIIATGSSFKNWTYLKSSETEMKNRQLEVENENKKLQKASVITIIGAGAVGVELAGEIAYKWPEKKIKLINSGPRILSVLDEKMSVRATELLEDLGVKIIVNQKMKQDSEGKWFNSDGEKVNSDLIYPALGTSIQSDWLGSSLEKTERGAVKVDKQLRAQGKNNIFVIGDINDVPELKLGALAARQAGVVVKNLKALLKDSRSSVKVYTPSKPLSLIPVGQKKGAVQLPFAFPHFMISIKQKDLFVSKFLK